MVSSSGWACTSNRRRSVTWVRKLERSEDLVDGREVARRRVADIAVHERGILVHALRLVVLAERLELEAPRAEPAARRRVGRAGQVGLEQDPPRRRLRPRG